MTTQLPEASTMLSSKVGMGGISLTFLLGVGGGSVLVGLFGVLAGVSAGDLAGVSGAGAWASSVGCSSDERTKLRMLDIIST